MEPAWHLKLTRWVVDGFLGIDDKGGTCRYQFGDKKPRIYQILVMYCLPRGLLNLEFEGILQNSQFFSANLC